MLRARWRLCVALADVVGSDRDPGRLEGALVPHRSVAARLEPEGIRRLVADERNAAMTELQQMSGRELAPGDVVDDDTRQPVMPRIDQHARDRLGAQPSNLFVGRDQRDDQQAVRPMSVGEEAKCALLTIRRLDVVEREVVRR